MRVKAAKTGMWLTNAYSFIDKMHRGRIHGIYHGSSRPYGIVEGQPVITTKVVHVSAKGNIVRTASGSVYRIKVA